MNKITASYFQLRVGEKPVQDDLERSNCPHAGNIGHQQCGWDSEFDLPVFMVGYTQEQRDHFRQHLWADYLPGAIADDS